MARGKAHSDQTRAEVISALLAGLGVTEVAQKYNLPKQTVSRIKNEIVPSELGQVGTEKRERIDELLLDGISSNLKALKAMTDMLSEKEYLRKQPASSIAEVYGTLADRAIRILEAASAAGIGE